MANIPKKGLDYFNLEVTFFSDRKIQRLIYYEGTDGVCIYLYLMCEVYKDGYYIPIDDDLIFILMKELNISSEDKVINSLKRLIDIGLLDKDLFLHNKVITSFGLQSRYSKIIHQCKRINTIDEYKIDRINSVTKHNLSEDTDINSEDIDINSEELLQSKVKKSKEEESKEEKSKNNLSLSDESDPQTKSFKNWTEKEFYNEIALLDFGTKENKREFYEYWIEKSASGKMRFTLNRTWETNLRLKTWIRKSDSITVVKSQFAKPDPQLPRDYLQDTGT